MSLAQQLRELETLTHTAKGWLERDRSRDGEALSHVRKEIAEWMTGRLEIGCNRQPPPFLVGQAVQGFFQGLGFVLMERESVAWLLREVPQDIQMLGWQRMTQS